MKFTAKKLKRLSASAGLVIGTAILAVSNSAYAASFTTNLQKNDGPEGDILLKSITQEDKAGKKDTFSNFSYVKRANILNNTPIKVNLPEYKTDGNGKIVKDKNGEPIKLIYTSNPEESSAYNQANKKKGITNVEMVHNADANSGAASTDKGDKASAPMAVSGMKNPTGNEIAAFVGNNNLNNIVDTEDSGHFAMDMFFDTLITEDNSGLDSVFFWERGMNSNLLVEAIDSTGKVISKALALLGQNQANDNADRVIADALGVKFDSKKVAERRAQATALGLVKNNQLDAGYAIDTMEIGSAQQVGSWGLSLKELGVKSLAGVRVSAKGTSYQGPDIKLIARKGKGFESTAVPEPSTILALGAVGGLAFLQRRRKQASLLK
ncbi:MAG: PEP-CTERM sorting domain-containing protein [Scytonematopsis contorta HA4267-MV1]|jgi:hypothetical protein|nr:PEP-CTERM sorting domain-containing protein [Scytonematopsis contorta HA4267-MV1]